LLPAATSARLWALSGHNATCTFLGTVNQWCLSVILCNGVLSYYYLLYIRFGVTARTFARRFEPWMHAIAIGNPFITSIIGASLNMYSEAALWTGCYVVDYPCGCHEEKGECKTEMVFLDFWRSLVEFRHAFIGSGQLCEFLACAATKSTGASQLIDFGTTRSKDQ
jgi:hypothetical protein